MHLWYAPTSPFARKVRIAAVELGLAERLELVEVNPWTAGRLRVLNPLSKVPTLVISGGLVLYGSSVICDYFDSLSVTRRLFPPAGDARWRALLLQGLSDGAATTAGRLFADEALPAAQHAEAMVARFGQAIEVSLDELAIADLSRSLPTIGEVSAAALLTHLDFRWPGHPWRQGRQKPANWFAAIEQRPSMTTTGYRLLAG